MQTAQTKRLFELKFLSRCEYAAVDHNDPLRFYYWPVIGQLYQRRVKMCLAECSGGKRVLEVGFGSGLTFLNLHDLYDEIYGLDLNAPVDEVAEIFKRRSVETKLSNGSVLQMPYEDGFFDTVLLISILEHLKPEQLKQAFSEIRRVLKKNGQVVYGVPVESPFMVFAFRMLGYDIRLHHFSTEKEVRFSAASFFDEAQVESLKTIMGPVYEVGHFVNRQSTD
jgi:ubiquinone/menaquinone biosynthesis C-methylase UbiE